MAKNQKKKLKALKRELKGLKILAEEAWRSREVATLELEKRQRDMDTGSPYWPNETIYAYYRAEDQLLRCERDTERYELAIKSCQTDIRKAGGGFPDLPYVPFRYADADLEAMDKITLIHLVKEWQERT